MAYPKFPRTRKRVKEEIVLPLTNIARQSPNLSSVTATSQVPKPHVLCNGFNPENIGKMPNRWLDPTCLWKRNEEYHNHAVRVWGELEWDDAKELKDLIGK